MPEETIRATIARRSAIVASLLNLFGMPIEIAIIWSVPGMSIAPAVVSIGCGLLFLVVLFACRRVPSVTLSHVVFLLNAVVIICALWVIDRGFASAGITWVPFQAQKLGMVTVALLAAEPWVAGAGIAMYALASLAQQATWPPQLRATLGVTEPWATLAFAMFAAILFRYRMKRTALERDVAVARAKVEASEQFTRRLMAIRDLANTPLQTIAFAAETARQRHPDLAPLLDRITRALSRLRAVDRQLREDETSHRERRAQPPVT
jgi:hypothetical protein